MFVMGNGSAVGLKDSVLDIVGAFVDTKPKMMPDLSISKVTLRKIADPTEDFNYYRYYANVIVQNNGGDIENEQVKLSAGSGQQQLFLKNSDEGFSLEQGQKYVLDRYELLFDANYNGGEVEFLLQVVSGRDADSANNKKKAEVLELPAKVDGIELETVKESGEYFIHFEENAEFYDHEVEIYLGHLEAGGDYAETSSGTGRYSYERLAIDREILLETNFEEVEYDQVDSYEVNIEKPLAEKKRADFLYVKVINPDNGYFAVSDVLKLPVSEELARADFAKYFVELTGESVVTTGESGFNDVDGSEWYAPYARTIYNLGLLSFEMENFGPEQVVTREQALKIVMDYYDAELSNELKFELKDVEKDDELYSYLGGFKRVDKVLNNGEFAPDEAASLDFLKYLIYACK